MSEQTGSSLAAIAARQAALADQHSALAEADRELADALAGAHAALRDSIGRLDAIAAEIDDAMPAEGGADTPIAARELQRFLVAKQREIASVVEHAHALDHTKAVQLQRLREQYTTDPG